MLFHLKQSRSLAGIIVACAILGATLFVPATNATTVNIKLSVSRSGDLNTFNFRTYFPITAQISVNNSAAGSTYFWQFGDGSNSTDPAPTHVYRTPCVYNIQVQVTASNGSIKSGRLAFGAFSTGVPQGRTLAVCPPEGTAGFISVEVAGGYFSANQQVTVMMDGASIGTVTAGKGGDWILDVSSYLTPEPNDTQFTFTTSPSSIMSVFTTLEGIRATPGSGAPGTAVQVEGRSYLPYSTVLVYLGGASLGTAVTDESGSFLSSFQIPFVSPLTQGGTYPYATFPPILGSQANFASSGSLGALFSSWWWWLLLIVLALVAAYLVRRRMRRRVVSPS